MNMSNGHKHCETEITITSAEESVKSSLIVVSNRLPFVLKKNAEGKMVRQARWVRLTFRGWCGVAISRWAQRRRKKRKKKKSVDKVCRLQSPLRWSISGCDRVTQKSASIAQHRKNKTFPLRVSLAVISEWCSRGACYRIIRLFCLCKQLVATWTSNQTCSAC